MRCDTPGVETHPSTSGVGERCDSRDDSTPAERIGGGYSAGQRAVETASVLLLFAGVAWMGARLAGTASAWWIAPVGLCAFALSALLADLISALVHWGCDTWGSIDTPVLGRAFIRQFREHHVDPEEINRHDFVETNGTNAGLSLLPLLVTRALPFEPSHPTPLSLGLQVGGVGVALFVTLTSQAHKWAHAPHVHPLVAALQRAGVLLSREHHAVHHLAPHLHNYAITGGWIDALLERGRVFRRIERLVTRLTGVEARAHGP